MYKSLFSCEDKIAIVTGGSGLIGREVVKGLHDFGAKVYVADINKKETDKIDDSKKINEIYCNINSENSVKKIMDTIFENDGVVDIFVNCTYPRTKDWG